MADNDELFKQPVVQRREEVEEQLKASSHNRPKRKVCANCKNPYGEGDRYCRFCGAPMGKPEFIELRFSTIYGPPPMERTHMCEKCGFTWKTDEMIDEERWCPKCGGSAPIQGEDDVWGFFR